MADDNDNNENMAKKLLSIVVQNLKEHDWHYSVRDFKDGEYGIDTDIKSRTDVARFYEIRMLIRKWDMTTLYYMPVKAPESVRGAVAEYLTRINWRIRYGKYEMDYEDGEIRYVNIASRYAMLADIDDVMSDSLDMMAHTADRYIGGLFAIIFGGKSPKAAFEEAIKPKGKTTPPPPPEPPAPPSGGGKGGKGGRKPSAKRRGKTASAPEAPAEGAPAPEGPVPADSGISPEEALLAEIFGEDSESGMESGKSRIPENYSLDGLNIVGKIPLEKIVAAVKKFRSDDRAAVDSPRLNILLSGAPGSGKTAFARYLANEVGAPLRTIRASDVMSKYVGDTERKLAKAFREAKRNKEILFIDECDSFLQSRAGADHGWEVTQVNELLQQMEDFSGVMIAATNFSENLDKAVMRRFTYKLKLDYLTEDGKKKFFDRYFKSPLTEEEAKRLESIANLTPGDFRTVREELYYLDDRQSNAARLDALEAESAAKGASRGPIGFAA